MQKRTRIFFLSCLLSFLVMSQTHAQQSSPFFELSQAKSQGTIESMIDSITFRLADGRKIKLIGLVPLDRPKRKDLPRNEYNIIIEEEENPIISFEERAYDFINDLIINKEVRLEFDNLYRDPKGYLLAYAFLSDGTFINAEIIRQGFSNLRITPPNTTYEKELRGAYLEAQKEKRGLQGN